MPYVTSKVRWLGQKKLRNGLKIPWLEIDVVYRHFSKFSVPTIAFLTFRLAKKLRL